MTPARTKELLPIMAAYACGKTIQFELLDGWHDYDGATKPKGALGFECEGAVWRIKPETKEYWIVTRNGFIYETLTYKPTPYIFSNPEFKVIHVKEVI